MKSTIRVFIVSAIAIACIPVAFIYSSNANRGYISRVQSLLEQGANINTRDEKNHGTPILSNAAALGRNELVSLLLSKGADIEVRDRLGKTPLMYAAGVGQVSTVQLLLSKGADKNSTDRNGYTTRVVVEARLKSALKADSKQWSNTEIANYKKIVQLLKSHSNENEKR
jgi:ankyrin repeat protein